MKSRLALTRVRTIYGVWTSADPQGVMLAYPDTDSQQLRALVRQARKDAKPEKPGAAPRHGRAYREIFQLVREVLLQGPDVPDALGPENDFPDNPGADA